MKKLVLKHCSPYETLNFSYTCLSQADIQCRWNLEPRSPQYRRSTQDVSLCGCPFSLHDIQGCNLNDNVNC
jgi:hypothetical protein